MTYKWRFYQYSVPAEVVGKTIEKIEKKHGECTAPLLLEEARNPKSKIHSLFEWDDTVAAEKWRLTQASQIITAVAVIYDENDGEPIVTRAFANVGQKNKGSFVTMAKAMSDEASRAIVLKHALEELQAFQSKYATLTELAGVFSAIEALQKAG